MNTIRLEDLNLLDVGNKIQLYGAIYSDGKTHFYLPLPDEEPRELAESQARVLEMGAAQWEKFLRQTDVLDVQGPDKAILRKSQRQIDQAIAWRVYERDGYRCRYCGQKRPLTVDHIILWEEGGLTVEENLVSACRRCNKLRGNMQYDAWLESDDCKRVSKDVQPTFKVANLQVRDRLPELQALKVKKQRSR